MDNAYINNDNNSEYKGEDAREAARQLYLQGRRAWQQGNRAEAITAYEKSAAIDPEGPGATALEMTRDIMDFYDTNQFNP